MDCRNRDWIYCFKILIWCSIMKLAIRAFQQTGSNFKLFYLEHTVKIRTVHNMFFIFWNKARRTKHVYVDIYPLNLFIEHSGEHWWEQNIFCSFTTPQAFWQSSAPGALSTLVTSVVLYSLTPATLMSPGKDETRACGYMYI